jgi:hypothetical protein
VLRFHRRLLIVAILALCLLRGVQTIVAASALGLPGLVGGDFIAYETAGRIVDQGDVRRLYDLDVQQHVGAAIEAAAGVPAGQQFRLAFDNPPPVALLLAPLAALPPAVGLAVWTLLNIGCTLGVAWLFLRRTPAGGVAMLTLTLGLLIFWPDFLGFFYGQMMGLVLLCYALTAYWLRERRDVRAGIALAVLVALKPQYALILLLVVLMQWRFRAIIATLLSGGALALLSLAMVGAGGLVAYVGELGALDPYAGNGVYLIDPGAMINWRSLLLHVAPSLPDTTGFLVTNLLAAGTVGVALVVWRRAERRGCDPFGWPFLVVTAATLLAAYHSHVHGAMLLLVPYAMLLQMTPTGAFRGLVNAAFWPPVVALGLLGPAVLALRPAISLYLICWLIAAMAIGWRETSLAAAPVGRRNQVVAVAPARQLAPGGAK